MPNQLPPAAPQHYLYNINQPTNQPTNLLGAAAGDEDLDPQLRQPGGRLLLQVLVVGVLVACVFP